LEGFEPSSELRDISVSVNYVLQGNLTGWRVFGSDALAVTVTPVIDSFSITPGRVDWKNGVNGLNGLATDLSERNGAPGASFQAKVFKENLAGEVTIIQNLTNALNGAHGFGAGWVFTGASGRPSLNTALTIAPKTFPVLDRIGDPPPPDVDSDFDRGEAQGYQWITADDSPLSGGSPPVSGDLASIDLELDFRLYLVWRYAQGILYTLAYEDWSVVFLADQNGGQDKGVTRLLRPDGITHGDPVRSHLNPVVVAPKSNGNLGFVPA
jgi:hypothetical protein